MDHSYLGLGRCLVVLLGAPGWILGGCAAEGAGAMRGELPADEGAATDAIAPGGSGAAGAAATGTVFGDGADLAVEPGAGDGAAGMGPDGTAGPGGRPSMGSTPLPCPVDEVLATSCRGCHGRAPGAQAPMALVTHEDLMAPAVSDPEKRVYQLVQERVHSDAAPMPPASGGRPLTQVELAALDGWLAGAMPAGEEPCGAAQPPEETLGTITYEPPGEDEIDQCYQLYAHANSVSGDTTPFPARSGEYYTAFFWEVPWQGEKQALEFRFNATSITHHVLLYDTTEPATDGLVMDNTTGTHPGAPDLLAAWAVNQQRVQFMPEEVGMALPVRGTGHRFLVEVHYFNSGPMVDDTSGIEICVGKELRPNTATVSWLGTEAIALLPGATADIAGTCTPQYAEDIYIFRSFPHMHEQGVRLDTVIKRADGGTEMLVDEAFDFNNQLMYDTPAVVHPGDQLITTCHYVNRTDRLIGVGYDSLSEMCFNFVYAWPAKALIGGVSLTGTSTPCLL